MIVGHIGGAGAPYEIQKSLRFRASASAYLSRTPSTAGNRKTWTWSGWVKRGALGTSFYELFSSRSGAETTLLRFNSDTITFIQQNASAVTEANYSSTAIYRDPSAWYHVALAVDTTQAVAGNRVRLAVNGIAVSLTASTTIPQNIDTQINRAAAHALGVQPTQSTGYFDGYLSEINFIDGQALDASYFGEISTETGSWIPKKYVGTYGTNGFYLSFNDGSSLANLTADRSGNGNNWTANNISLTAGVTYDWMDDTPSNNFAVLNPLNNAGTRHVISQGNLAASLSGTADDRMLHGTMFISSGKGYFEYVFMGGASVGAIGIASNTAITSGGGVPQANSVTYLGNGSVYKNGVNTGTVTTYTVIDVIGVAFDLDALTVAFYKNGVLVTTVTGIASDAYSLATFANQVGDNFAVNFGQRPFAYTPPAGFKALCTKNLPTPSILNPKKHFDVVLATGANIKSTAEAVFPSNFLEWIKDRGNANNHQLVDIVRGTSAVLQSNTTAVETTYAAPSGSSVAWLWKAGGAPVTNNAGSIQSQVSANPQAGFSIVAYTGTGANATVGHGLGVAPKMVIVKTRGSANVWRVGHGSLTSWAHQLTLNDTAAQALNMGIFNSTAPTSSVFSVGTSVTTNENNRGMVAYCFAEILGYSKIGSYTGNGSADGPFVYCGFRPRYVLIRRTDAGPSNWTIHDTSRETGNVQQAVLYPHLSNAEGTQSALDILSNGFKLRHTTAEQNGSGATYIFAAFAEQPFKFANAR